jgi:phospholipid/cholesterol/gamma-HCH transport system permease protein
MDAGASPIPLFTFDQTHVLTCQGDWTILSLTTEFEAQITTLPPERVEIINAETIARLDSAGAELLIKLTKLYPKAQIKLTPESQNLLALIKQYAQTAMPPPKKKMFWLELFGKQMTKAYAESLLYLNFFGEVCYYFWSWLLHPGRILWRNIAKAIEQSGVYAIGIIGLLSFLVGIVLTYQMGEQLKSYGANIFVVNLLGISILREFAPLITAIIVSGRSGSAFTAELGTMAVNQELNALTTMGVKPVEFLVLPKIIGLLIALPLLSMWSAFIGIFGGMIMSKLLLGITFNVFIDQLETAVAAKQLWIGLMKAPVFALLISTVGCFQGLQIKGGAESIGLQTTRSVVQSLFLIIIADAFFSIILSIFHA